MQVIEIHAHTGSDGKLLVELPTKLRNQHLDLVIILNRAHARPLPQAATLHQQWDAIAALAGKLTWRGDACKVQRSMRDEW